MTRLTALALLPALLLLSACAPSAEPEATPTPTAIAAPPVDGEWVMTRTVTADTTGEFETGTVETRYVIFDAPECDETSCTGTVHSSASEDIFTGATDATTPVETTYAWDGTALTYTFDPLPIDCSGDDGAILVKGLYTNQAAYTLQPGGDGFTGSVQVTYEVVGDPGDSGCPDGGVVDYDAEVAPHS